MPLTAKQAAFVREYLVDSNGKQAAIRAGYAPGSAEVTASKLLRNPKVAEAVAAGRSDLDERAEHTRAELEEKLWAIVLGDLRDVLEWGPGGARLKASAELTEAQAALVRELRLDQQQFELGEEAEAWLVKSVVKTHDPIRAAQLLARMRGWLVDRVEHSGTVGLTLEGLHRLANNGQTEEA